MIHEFPGTWKIDIPDSVDGPKLQANLERELTAVKNMKDQWPADQNDAYRLVGHHILMAVMDAKPASGDRAMP